jgi:hypothetical protein
MSKHTQLYVYMSNLEGMDAAVAYAHAMALVWPGGKATCDPSQTERKRLQCCRPQGNRTRSARNRKAPCGAFLVGERATGYQMIADFS